jgi:THO complex subunit, putative
MCVNFVENVKEHFSKNNRIRDYQSHSSKVHSVDWNCDGRRLASGSFDKTVSIFNLDKDRLNKDVTLKGHADSVDQLCWHPTNPDLLATASLDKTVRLWDSRWSKNLATINTKGNCR